MKMLCFLKDQMEANTFHGMGPQAHHGHHPLHDLQTIEAFIHAFLIYVCIYICFTYVCIFYMIK